MPLYHRTLLIKAKTPAERPAELTIEVKEPLVVLAGVRFRKGTSFLVHVAFFYGIKQLWPEEAGTAICGEDEFVLTAEWFRVPELPFRLTVKGWSPDSPTDSVVYIRILTLPLGIMEAFEKGLDVLKKLLAFFKEVVGI